MLSHRRKQPVNGADVMTVTGVIYRGGQPVKLRKPIVDHYVSIPTPTDDAPDQRTSYHLRTNIPKHDLTTKRFFKTARETYAFIKRNGHPITECHTGKGCPGRIE